MDWDQIVGYMGYNPEGPDNPAESERHMEKSLNVASMEELKAKVSDVQVSGNPGAWVVLGKASSEAQGGMKSTKAMQTPVGVLVQASTQQRNPDGSCAVAEALTFVPGALLRQVSGNHWEFAPAG
jgi:hypothetical protein